MRIRWLILVGGSAGDTRPFCAVLCAIVPSHVPWTAHICCEWHAVGSAAPNHLFQPRLPRRACLCPSCTMAAKLAILLLIGMLGVCTAQRCFQPIVKVRTPARFASTQQQPPHTCIVCARPLQ
jgi:hypothetical protein